jgi:hypothetical protein
MRLLLLTEYFLHAGNTPGWCELLIPPDVGVYIYYFIFFARRLLILVLLSHHHILFL